MEQFVKAGAYIKSTFQTESNLITEQNPEFAEHIHNWGCWLGSEVLLVEEPRAGLLGVGWGGILWMPPLHDPHTLYRIQQHLGSTMIGSFLPSLEWRVLEEQTNPVVAHVCADIDCELNKNRMKQGEWDRSVTDKCTDRPISARVQP